MTQKTVFPEMTLNKLSATNEISNEPQKVLFVGQKVAAGTATAGDLIENIGNDNSWDTLFGANSMLAGMLREARAVNDVTRFDAISLDDDGSAVAATADIVFTGPATEDGEIVVKIGSSRRHSYTLTISDTDTATDIGDALDAAILADTNAPFSSSNVAGTVTITADNKGPEGNFIGIKVSGTVAGVSYTVAQMASGATAPTLTNIFDVIAGERYQTIIFPYSYGTTFVTDFLEPRWNIDNDVLDGVGITSSTDTKSNIATAVNALNFRTVCIHANKLIADSFYKGSALFELDYVISAKFGALRALRLTQDANITRYVITTAANDQSGGPSIATLPYANTPIFDIDKIDTGKGFTDTEVQDLRDKGAFVISNNASNVLVDQVVTTYKTDAASNSDITFKYLNYVDTISNYAEYVFNNAKADFAQSRLTEGDLRAGFDIHNAGSIRTRALKYYQDCTGDVYLLVQSGEDAIKFFKNNLSVTVDIANGKVTINEKVPIVTQLRQIIGNLKVSFSIN